MNKSTNLLRQTLQGSKKLVITMALLLTVGISFSFAAPTDELRAIVKASFQRDFKGAMVISVENHPTFTKLVFDMDSQIFYAYYSDLGELMAVTRNLPPSQLPMPLLIKLKKDYTNYWISDLFEITKDGESRYYVTLENADTKLILRSENSFDDWDFFRKDKKTK